MVVLVLAALLAATDPSAVPPTPAPTATPLKVIIDVRSLSPCQARIQITGDAVPGLLADDRIAGQAVAGVGKMTRDQREGGQVDNPALRLDAMNEERLIAAIAHNIAQMRQIIAESSSAKDDALIAKLEAAIAAQENELNALSGWLETLRMGEYYDDRPWSSSAIAFSLSHPSGAPDDHSVVYDAGLDPESSAGHVDPLAEAERQMSPTEAAAPTFRTLRADAYTTDARENDLANALRTEINTCRGKAP